MGKPLLTDEMIERANRGEAISGPPLFDEEETKILPTGNRGFGYERPVTSGKEIVDMEYRILRRLFQSESNLQ